MGELDRNTWRVRFDVGDAAERIATDSLATNDTGRDFLGRNVPVKQALPGPFQQLQPGTNEFQVWPLPADSH